MKRQSCLSPWIGSKKQASNGNGEENGEFVNETEIRSLAENDLRHINNFTMVSEETLESDCDPGEYDGDESAASISTNRTQTVIISALSDGMESEKQQNWCEIFCKKDGKKGLKIKFARCKICISYPSIVRMHCYHQ